MARVSSIGLVRMLISFLLSSYAMKALEDLAAKHPAFVVQLAAVMQGRKPVARVEFEFHGEDYAKFIELLSELKLVWFEHSPYPVRICFASALYKEAEKYTKVRHRRHYSIQNYDFLRLSALLKEYEGFWSSLTERKIMSLEISGGELNSSFEFIAARNFKGLKDFLTQYAIARKQQKDFRDRRAMAMELFDRILGTAFGYPECCTERFSKDRKEKQPKEDYIFYESIVRRNLESAVPVELRAVGHVPCDITCRPSIDLGKEYLAALREFDLDAYRKAIKELKKPTLFLDRWHRLTIDEIERDSVSDLIVTEEQFISKATKKMETKPRETVLASIETVPFRYLPEFLGLWWIAVNPGHSVFMCNAKTGDKKSYKMNSARNPADLRILRYR